MQMKRRVLLILQKILISSELSSCKYGFSGRAPMHMQMYEYLHTSRRVWRSTRIFCTNVMYTLFALELRKRFNK